MDVGVVGIGDIATKAYLPLLATWPGVRLHLASRDEVRLEQAARRFRATLVASARQHRTLLAVGFNRRFAPAYRRVAEGAPQLVVLGKHRPDLADLPRRVIFDDLIHVVDTLRWLTDAGVVSPQVTGHVDDDRLHHVTFTFAHEGRHAIGLMNRCSGTTREVLEAHQREATTLVHDLAHTEVHGTSHTATWGPDSWSPTLEVRGFVAMLEAFFAAVAGQPSPTPSAEDALATHETCEHILERL
ncbi:MAG: hypothetical protein ACLFRD_01100 [Nitriliruptoraceae bacterium]